MKSNLILASLLTLVSCGKPTGTRTTTPAPYEPTRITNLWVNLRDGSELDLRAVTINQAQIAWDIIDCDGTLGNNGKVNGTDPKTVFFTGSNFEGSVQFGHLEYVNASDLRCRAFSKERYEYKMIGDTLRLKNIEYCAKHQCTEDGIEFFELAE